MISVPDYFQEESEEALRSQVEWLEQHLGLGDNFFARFLRQDQGIFSAWRRASATLDKAREDVLHDLWRTVLHLLSFQNFDEVKARTFLEQRAPPGYQPERSLFSPPWSGSSLKEYLENCGSEALQDVDRWVESFRFGDPYAPPRKGGSCLSTRP